MLKSTYVASSVDVDVLDISEVYVLAYGLLEWGPAAKSE